jgi:hypothetical protein
MLFTISWISFIIKLNTNTKMENFMKNLD